MLALPKGSVWTCIECGVELETPTRLVPKDGVCSLCKTDWQGPQPCGLPEGQWCLHGWHHRIDAHGVKHVSGRCPRDLQRTADEKAARYLDDMRKKGLDKGFRDFDRGLNVELFDATLEWAKSCEGRCTLALLGPPGTGKSHLLTAARYYVLRRNLTTAWIDRTDLTLMVNAYRAMGQQIDRLLPRWESWCECEVLFVDDLGHEVSPAGETAGVLCDLLDERGAAPLAFASNMTRSDLEARYEGPLVSRLFHASITPRVRPGDQRNAA